MEITGAPHWRKIVSHISDPRMWVYCPGQEPDIGEDSVLNTIQETIANPSEMEEYPLGFSMIASVSMLPREVR